MRLGFLWFEKLNSDGLPARQSRPVDELSGQDARAPAILMHSVIGGLLFYSYGLGLFMKLGPAWTFLICIVIYSFQIPFSAWWLKRYRFGPMEWVWRSLTYGSLQAMRRTED